jgi:hypothetical protein
MIGRNGKGFTLSMLLRQDQHAWQIVSLNMGVVPVLVWKRDPDGNGGTLKK